MFYDDELKKVVNVALAILPREDEKELWDTYLINLQEYELESVLINSKGYGDINGEKIRTTTLKHFYETLQPLEAVRVEPIQRKLFSLTNEYWLSFQKNGYSFDKRYVFVIGSIHQENFTKIPVLDRLGVMIK